MKIKTKRAYYIIIVTVLMIVAGILVNRYNQPLKIEPDPNWETTITSMKAAREHFFIKTSDAQLEADLLIPYGGREVKPAVVFAPGSGSHIYQAYAPEFIEYFLLGVLLPRDVAVLLVNKRGMGNSSGNWMHNDIQGRADDVYDSVQYLQNHPAIDHSQIGLIGHSQGGWVVTLTAIQHEDVAFFISLAGPTTTVFEQMEADARNFLLCQGYEGDLLTRRLERDLQMDQIGASLGKIIPVGEIGFMSGIMDFDPHEALQTVNVSGLLVYGELDPQVPPAMNLARFDKIFSSNHPDHLDTVVIANAQHVFRLMESKCMMYEDYSSGPLSDELIVVLQNWLAEQGY